MLMFGFPVHRSFPFLRAWYFTVLPEDTVTEEVADEVWRRASDHVCATASAATASYRSRVLPTLPFGSSGHASR